MNTGEDMSPVGFDLHAPAAAVALLSAPKVAVNKSLVHGQACGQPGEECDQGFAVGFSGSEVAQHKQLILTDELPHDRTRAAESIRFSAVTLNTEDCRIVGSPRPQPARGPPPRCVHPEVLWPRRNGVF